MKVTVGPAAADYAVRKQASMHSLREGFLPIAVVVRLVGALLQLEPELGAFMVIAAVAFGILFLGGVNARMFLGLGSAMVGVRPAAAGDLGARKSKGPLVTPTATTHGIAALGDGIFQLNVTTGTLGQRIASYATGCLKLKDFAIVAPESEYGYQLAEAFQKTVEKKGGNV